MRENYEKSDHLIMAKVSKQGSYFVVIIEICFYNFEKLDHFVKPFLIFGGSILRNLTLVRLG